MRIYREPKIATRLSVASRFKSVTSGEHTQLLAITPGVIYFSAMPPSADRLEDTLRSAVEEVYRSENQNNLTVRFVREKVENELGLDQGFFLQPDWKDRSKHLIKSWAVCVIHLTLFYRTDPFKDEIDRRRRACCWTCKGGHRT